MRCLLLFAFAYLIIPSAHAQYSDYIGSGHSNGVVVNSSDEFYAPSMWQDPASAINTLNGKGLNFEHYQAGRFLSQASLGYEKRHIDDVVAVGIEDWIDNQIALPPSYILPVSMDIVGGINDSILIADGGDSTNYIRDPDWLFFNYAWWDTQMTNEDLLRHKVANALAQIMVVSRNGFLRSHGNSLSSFYDILMEHAFGNFEDLLYDITLSPTMGHYLTFVNNPKTVLSEGIHPDENYAREIMQLFSIGLYELNTNGTRKVDGNGDWIPTYGQDDIRELAKVFTGLSYGAAFYNGYSNVVPRFGLLHWNADFTVPMIMYDTDDPATYEDEDQHENGDKVLFGNQIVEANSSGLAEIQDAINIIFNHENVGPFISHLLIQKMVKSNPSPAYIARVATVFNNNGQGVRGDMEAVIKAILLDEEARNCSFQENDANAKLKEPFLRLVHFSRAIDKISPSGEFWNEAAQFFRDVGQDILASPSVFNFWLPTHTPFGPISNQGLVAPEFQLHSSRTSVGYMNYMHRVTTISPIMFNQRNSNTVSWNKEDLYPLIEDPEAYLNYMDLRFTNGDLSDFSRRLFRRAMLDINSVQHQTYYQRWRVENGMYFILISPDYSIQR